MKYYSAKKFCAAVVHSNILVRSLGMVTEGKISRPMA